MVKLRRSSRSAILIALLLAFWQLATLHPRHVLPSPLAVLAAILGLARSGLLFRYMVASLFRVSWGFLAATLLGIPLGLLLGSFRRAGLAIYPVMQLLRPISPLAWIPIAILFFGVGDLAAIFLIFLGCFFPLLLASFDAARSVPAVFLNAGRNFDLNSGQLLRRVLLPATIPQILIAMRISLGIAWLVVVAAEMIAVNSGLGFLIVDARNAGERYDLVVAGMLVIGLTGLTLDRSMRSLERIRSFRWGYPENA